MARNNRRVEPGVGDINGEGDGAGSETIVQPDAGTSGNVDVAPNGDNPSDDGIEGSQDGTGKPQNPDAVAGPAVKRKRGRPPGTGSKGKSGNGESGPKASNAGLDVKPLDARALAPQIQFIHAALATALKQPIWQIDDAEANDMATAIAELSKHYNFQIDPKKAAWIGLGMVCMTTYGKRIMYLRAMKAQSVSAAQPSTPAEAAVATMHETIGAKGGVDFSAVHEAERRYSAETVN